MQCEEEYVQKLSVSVNLGQIEKEIQLIKKEAINYFLKINLFKKELKKCSLKKNTYQSLIVISNIYFFCNSLFEARNKTCVK